MFWFCWQWHLCQVRHFVSDLRTAGSIWLSTSNSCKNSDFWQTCSYSRLHNKYFWIVRFLDTGIILKSNSWVTTYENQIGIPSTEYLAILFCIYKSKIGQFVFLKTTPNAPSHHPKYILLLENIILRNRTNWMWYKSNNCRAFSCDDEPHC